MDWTTADRAMMQESLAEAARGRGRTHPNPAVGAVVARAGAVLGRGWHRGPGTPHAEVEAIREAGDAARGADLFVTLEPCCTWGRTPPCTDAIAAAGLRRVVAACPDPNPAVRGKGFDALRAAGIEVACGLLGEEGRAADPAYHHFWEAGRPFVHLKWAQSLDGRVTRPGGGPLTGPEARARVHAERALADAILVSAGTVLADAPRLTVREGFGPKSLLRVILDRRGRIRGTESIFATSDEGEIWVIRPESAAGEPFSPPQGASLKVVADGPGHLPDLGETLGALAAARVIYLYAEAVGRLSRALLDGGLVDRISVHVAPLLLGGEQVPALGDGPGDPAALPDLRGADWERLGGDWATTVELARSRAPREALGCSRG